MAPVHPEIAAFLATLPPSDGSPVDVAAWRAMGEAHLPSMADRPPVAVVEDLALDVSGASAGAGERTVPVRIYRAAAGPVSGLIISLHGGAFFSGSLETHDVMARSLTRSLGEGWAVLSVGYRLAPEAAFPAGLDDSFAVLQWVLSHQDELDWSGERLALVGDSSGGNFVAALTAMAADAGVGVTGSGGATGITHQVLLYPSVDLDFDLDRYPSLRENGVGYGLETVALRPHNAFYLESGADPADPLVSPIKRADLAGLPPALIITAEYDPLRDEGEAYGRRLEEAGVPVTVHRYAGATHGFVQHFGHLPEYAAVFDEVAAFLRA